jgi:hypothetical protein
MKYQLILSFWISEFHLILDKPHVKIYYLFKNINYCLNLNILDSDFELTVNRDNQLLSN